MKVSPSEKLGTLGMSPSPALIKYMFADIAALYIWYIGHKTFSLRALIKAPCASICVVSKLVNMETMQAIGQTSQLPSHLHRPTEGWYVWGTFLRLYCLGYQSFSPRANVTVYQGYLPSCSKWTVPVTAPSPLSTHTAFIVSSETGRPCTLNKQSLKI